MAAFRKGSLEIVTTRDLFNEGVDVPDVDMIVFMRVTHSRRIFVQQLGRGLRISPRKKKVVVLDFVSDLRRLADRPVVMTGGIARENGHIAIPISPDKLFVATMYPAFAEWLGRWPTGRLVRESNAAQIGQARKYVYAVDDSPIAEVRRGMPRREYMSLINEPRSILARKA